MGDSTWSSSKRGSAIVLTGDNLVATNTQVSDNQSGVATNNVSITTGKYYWEVTYNEVTFNGSVNRDQVGIIGDTESVWTAELGLRATAYMYASNGAKRNSGSTAGYGTTYDDGDVIGVAFDRTNGILWFSKNGTWQNGATIGEVQTADDTNAAYNGLTSGGFLACATVSNEGVTEGRCTLHPTAGSLTYTVPSGFTAGLPAGLTNDGVAAMNMSVASAGTVSPIHGDVTTPMSLDIISSGTVSPIHGDATTPIGMAVASSGTVSPIHGNGVAGLNFSITASGSIPIRATGTAAMDFAVAATGTITFANGAVVLPLLEAAGNGLSGESFSLDEELFNSTSPFAFEATGSGLTGEVGIGQATLPSLSIEAFGDHYAEITLPNLRISGAALASGVANSALILPQLSVSGQFSLDLDLVGDVTLPRLQVSGSLAGGQDAASAGSFCILQVAGQVQSGELGTGAVSLLSPEVTGTSFNEGLITASILVPQLSLVSEAAPPGFVASAWSMNTENFGATNYVNFDFHTLGEIGGVYVGITSTGIYTLSGEDDDGTHIDAEFLTGFDDFNIEFEKNVDKVYLGYTADGDLVLLTNTDGEERTKVNDVTHKTHEDGLKRARVSLGKGVRSRYWQAGLKNCNGADFEITELGLLYRQLSRKI